MALFLPLFKQNEGRELSSAGSEHLPYKQRVGGSNPSTPTQNLEEIRGFFCVKKFKKSLTFYLKNFLKTQISMFLDFCSWENRVLFSGENIP